MKRNHAFMYAGLLMTASNLAMSNDLTLEGFTNINGNRFYAVRMPAGTTEKQVKDYIESRVVHDRGRVANAFFYDSGARIPTIIDGAKDVFNANGIIYDNPRFDKWRYGYQKALNGTETFVDCNTKPKDALCRQ